MTSFFVAMSTHHRFTTIAAVMAALVGPHLRAYAAAATKAERRPNVVFLLSDDQRADTIHALGNDIIHTPNFDRLVKRGTAFLRAVAPNPICSPSRAEIMTGCTSFRTGVLNLSGQIRGDLALWARTMQEAGYHTYYVGKWHNDGLPTERGYTDVDGLFAGGDGRPVRPTVDWHGRPVTGYQGWMFQAADGRRLPEKGVGLTPNISAQFADAAIRVIHRDHKKPFFLQVNFTAPHDPLLIPRGYEKMYDPRQMPVPPNFMPQHPFDHGNLRGRDEQLFAWPRTKREVREELAVYYAVISHMDTQIGRILQALEATDQLDNTIVVFTSDHGLAIGSHGLRGKQNMHEHTISVPLIFSGPGIPPNNRCDAQCYLRDLFPTICDLVGIPIPNTVQAHSLKPLLDGEVQTVYSAVFGYYLQFQRMIRTDQWKLICYPQADREQLFNIEKDPFELHDLSQDSHYAKVLTDLRKQLTAWQSANHDPLVAE